MEIVIGDRLFYATFGTLSEQEAEQIFRDYYGREPEVVTVLHGRTIAGPVTNEELNKDYIIDRR